MSLVSASAMRLLWFLLSITFVFHSPVESSSIEEIRPRTERNTHVVLTAGKERRSNVSGTSATILTPDFIETVQEIVDAGGVQGLTLAIVNKTGPAELGAWGIKSENGTNMTTDTLFNIGSCSKAFLSASLGIVIDDFAHGRNTTPLPAGLSSLTWKTKVVDILPNDWQLMDPWASQKANLIDILTHLSGVGTHDFSYKKNNTFSDIARNLRNFRPTFELREQFLYNNQMYMIGAYIVSTLAGMRYPDFVDSRIFKPLGMTSSTYSIDTALQTGRFTDTWTSFGRLIPPWMEEEFVDLAAGPGGVISSVEDLTPWLRTILNSGIDPSTNATIIPSPQFDTITSAHSIANPNVSAETSTWVYGLGWARVSFIGHDVIVHDGGVPGVSAVIAAAPEDGIGIIVLVNADSKAEPITNIIVKAAEKAFGSAVSSSSPANQTTVSRRSKRQHPARVTARADDGASGVDLTGTYYNAGYGTCVLCSVHSSLPPCESVLDAFRSIDPSLSTSTDLFASWETVFSTHLRFNYTNDNNYLISTGSIYPQGYGKNTTPFSTLIPFATAEFVVENEKVVGFGWNITGDDGDVKQSGSVEETSEVWFVKKT